MTGDSVQTDWPKKQTKPEAIFGTEPNVSRVLCNDKMVYALNKVWQ